MAATRRIFVIYAHEDDDYRIELRKTLLPLERDRSIEIWDDREISPGTDWSEEIDGRLGQVDLFLPLVSRDFIASEYIQGVELKRALERHDDQADGARVVPIIIRKCAWKESPLGRLEALPDKGRTLTEWDDPDGFWLGVDEGLRRLLRRLPERAVPTSGDAGKDPRPYLETLVARNRYVEIQGLGAKVAERMELRQVYTRLQVAAQWGRSARSGRARQEGAPEDLLSREAARERELSDVLREHDHAVLVGDPGSGKTTFLRFVALNLARLHLDPGDATAREALALEGEAPFPLLVRLADFVTYLREPGAAAGAHAGLPAAAPEHFYLYLDELLRSEAFGLPGRHLRDRLLAGGCFLLLDGLDEVPGRDRREQIARIVESVVIAGQRAGNRHLVSCRTRAYEGGTQLLAGDFETFRLAPFGRDQIEEFVRGWSRALHRVPEGDSGSAAAREAERTRADLIRAIDGHPDVGPLTESPLMLTVLAVVHWNRKRLPEQRADLYNDTVECLLERRRRLSPHPPNLRREALQALALRMVDHPDGVQRTLGRADAATAVADLLGADHPQAIAFLEEEELYSGLIVSRMEGEVEFWHLTFEEYLAALELSRDPDHWSRVEPHLYDDRWNEVVLLLGGCLRRDAGVRAARKYLQNVLDAGSDLVGRARAVGLAGRILRDIRPYRGDPEKQTTFEATLRGTLSIFEPDGPEVEESIRIEVGEALGQAGDPRLVDAQANRILIEGGTFARDDAEGGRRRVTVSSFELGRYPVTVQEFDCFVEAGARGYQDSGFWGEDGLRWRKTGWTAPGDWKEQLRYPNRPVTKVSWHEADAYCRWVGGRLPTEAEWEFAAGGKEGRGFPWGDDDPMERHAAFDGRQPGPSPVGIYPLGATPEGVEDLAGNVWEWCRDWYVRLPANKETDPQGPDAGMKVNVFDQASGKIVKAPARVLCGGSFGHNPDALRSARRNRGRPEDRGSYVGFRVSWSASGGP